MVSWLFHCFKCGYNKSRRFGSRSSKNLSEIVPSPGTNYEIGNSYDDLYKVRGSHDYYYQSLVAACNSHLEEERCGDFHQSLCDASQEKTWKESRLGVIHINANETEEQRINCEPVDLRKKNLLLQDATKLPSDEVKYHRASHSVIHNKSAIGLDDMHCSCFVSPGILDGLLVDSSTPSSRSQSYNKECPLEINDPIDKVEVAHQGHSPPWIISYKNPEVSEDLLLDHIDISCLIEDSVLISDWENSFTTLSSGKEGPNDESIKEQQFPESKIALQKIELIMSSQCEMSEADSSSASIVDEFEFEQDMITLSFCTSEGDGEIIDSRELSNSEMGFRNKTLSEHWICMEMEEMGNLAVSDGCFMPHINLSMQSWSNLRRFSPEHVLLENRTSKDDHDFHELLPLQIQSFECEEELSFVSSPQSRLVGCNEDDSIVNCQFSELHSFNKEWVCDNSLESPGRVDDMVLPSSCILEEGVAHPTEVQDNNDVSEAFDHDFDCDCDHDHDHCFVDENENGSAEQAKGLGETLDHVYMESNVSPGKQENDNESCFAEEAICLGETLNYQYVEANESSVKQENCPMKKAICCSGEPLLCVNMESNGNQVMQESDIENGFTEEAISLGEALDYDHVDSIESLVKQESVTVNENAHVIENENENEDENENKIEVEIKHEIEIENDSGKWQSHESMMKQDEAPLRDMHAMYGDDRPILGTVAAHWSPISVSTSKWWDGKGIPNSTYKYKEDQKVSWHAIPFEERLEKALAKQDCM